MNPYDDPPWVRFYDGYDPEPPDLPDPSEYDDREPPDEAEPEDNVPDAVADPDESYPSDLDVFWVLRQGVQRLLAGEHGHADMMDLGERLNGSEWLREEYEAMHKTGGVKVTVYKDQAGEFRWRAQADNGQVIADSAEGYVNRADCVGGFNVLLEACRRGSTEFVIEPQAV